MFAELPDVGLELEVEGECGMVVAVTKLLYVAH